MHKYANIRIPIDAYIYMYIPPFKYDDVYIKLNNPEPHTQWHCPGINPIIQRNVPGPVRNQSDANSVGSVSDRSRFSMAQKDRSLLSPIRFDRLLNQEVHRQQINTDLNNAACHRLVGHYSNDDISTSVQQKQGQCKSPVISNVFVKGISCHHLLLKTDICQTYSEFLLT